MYAIIATGGKQYKVAEGDVIRVEKLGVEAGQTYNFDQVLAVNNGEMIIGTPTVAGATVSATVMGEGRAKKVIVYKYKRKTGYHKKNGHRQSYTELKIVRDASKAYVGFSIKGHAGYAEHGQDIICAAVSVLAQNTVNSIEQFTDDTFSGEIDEKTGSLAVSFPHGVGKDSRLLLDSMVLGLTSIAEEYGKKYIKIRFREV